MKKISVIKGYGNHSNLLFQSIHFHAFCIENNIQYFNLPLARYSDIFPRFQQFNNGFLSKSRILKKLKLLKTLRVNETTLDVEILSCLDKTSRLILEGWGYRAQNLVDKYISFFRDFYKLDDSLISDNQLFSQLKSIKNTHTLIGVHVRRGDYLTWNNGKYYFSDEVYVAACRSIQSQLDEKGLNSFFVITSDENFEKKNLGFEFTVSREKWFIDQSILAMCDFIVGPPSTFSMWASLMGSVPCYHIKGIDDCFRLSEFSVVSG